MLRTNFLHCKPKTENRKLTAADRTLKLLLLCLPPLLAVWIWRAGQCYDPAFTTPPADPASAAAAAAPVTLPAALGAWQAAGIEWLPAARMFERINGRASFYEGFGARGLLYAGWTSPAGTWDLYLYLMNDANGARGAFLAEAAGANQQFALGAQARGTAGTLFFVQGAAYGQLLAAQPDATPASVTDLAAHIIARLPAAASELDPTAYLRHPAVTPDTLEYAEADAFGYQSLTRMYSAQAVVQKESATWLVAVASNSAAARDALRRYADELRTFGVTDAFPEEHIAGGAMLGVWELLACSNTLVYGVREAGSHAALTQHWHALHHHLHQARP